MSNSVTRITLVLLLLLVQGCYCRPTPRSPPVPVSDAVVSKDGTGNFTTLTEAVKNIPGTTTKFTIHVKAGLYVEENIVEISRDSVTIIGDGMGKTIIQSSRSNSTGFELTKTAALVASGNNFIAMDITFENTAGPSAEQAVAFKSAGDKSAFYRCSFLGFQDTLYVSKGRQFFRDCVIEGTVDFIFGEAAVVFQNCTIKLRNHREGGTDTITAQKRESSSENTGITLQKCTITGARGFDTMKTKSFFGRPWKDYATTMVMQCFIDGVIDPSGWFDWNNRLNLNTITYREYANQGPGSSTVARIKKPSYKVVTDPKEAEAFTAAVLINGEEWLPATKIPFKLGLY